MVGTGGCTDEFPACMLLQMAVGTPLPMIPTLGTTVTLGSTPPMFCMATLPTLDICPEAFGTWPATFEFMVMVMVMVGICTLLLGAPDALGMPITTTALVVGFTEVCCCCCCCCCCCAWVASAGMKDIAACRYVCCGCCCDACCRASVFGSEFNTVVVCLYTYVLGYVCMYMYTFGNTV